MTIVASNSLTVSNVNDGTITHTAYANSADGTDGFYIGGGSNLLTGTSIDLIVDDSSNTNLGWKFASVYNGLIAGYVYTFSSEVSVLGSATSIDVRPYNPKTGMTITDSYTTFSIVDGKISGLVKPRDGYTQLLIYAGNQGNTHGNKVTFHHMKLEKGSTATPWSPAPSEAHPSYIGQYTDFSSTASTDPDKYAPWTVFKGDDGTGIKTTTITYAGSTSGTTAPTSGWTTTVPTVAAGSYLWTKTVWTYTDNTSETGYSVAKMGNDGATGPQGPAGSNGDPGKIVSDTEPTTRFKGLTWKYSGTADLTASDGTVIKPNIEYYFNGTKWVISLVEANQINVDTLAAISAYLGHVYAAIVEDNQSDGSGFLLDSEKQLLRVNKTANTYNQIFSEGLTTFAKISDLPGIGNIIPGANYISAILAGNFIQFGQYSTAVNSNGVPVGGTPVGLGTISFGQTSANSYGFTLTGDLTVAGNIKSLKDTDWIDIPPASGWGGTMRYMIAEGKFYLRLTNVTNPAVSATTARTMCTIPTTAVPLGGIRGIPIMSYGQPIAELVINANGTIQFYSHDAVGTGQSLHVFVQGIPLT